MNKFVYNRTELGYDDLVSDTTDAGRKYVTPDGNMYPSVTSILSGLSQEALDKWRDRVGQKEADRISHHASTRGNFVHEACEKYIRNAPKKEFSKYMPHVMANVNSLKPILDENLDEINGIEVPLYSDKLKLAGRCDLVGKWLNIPSIIDYKTSAKPKKREWIDSYFIQTSAYAEMWEERTGEPIDQIVVLIMVDNHQPQVFIDDKNKWLNKLSELIVNYSK